MRQVTLEYKHTSEKGPNFIFPKASTQMSNDIFDKARAFGVTLGLPFNLRIQEGRAHLFEEEEPGMGWESIVEPKDGLLIIPMGLEIRIPDGYALFNLDLLHAVYNFIVDKTVKEWYRVNLYLLATHSYFKEGTPALKILPISDTLYDFDYRRLL